MTLRIKSKNIIDGHPIEKQFTKYGANKTPDISWSDVPNGTKELLLICYDPDAKSVAGKIWVHWLVTAIDPKTNKLTNNRYYVMKNSFDDEKYDGPKPPSGTGVHNYHFKIIALDKYQNFDINKAYDYDDVIKKINGHVLEESEIVGTYVK